MRVDEAIKALHRHYVLFHNVPRQEVIEAARLGIEAMKRLKSMRDNKPPLVGDMEYCLEQLPSETEEEDEAKEYQEPVLG